MATSTQIREWIAAAENARHAVAIGGAVIDVWEDGSRVRRSISSLTELQAYIDRLNRELAAALLAESGSTRPARRAISMVFRN